MFTVAVLQLCYDVLLWNSVAVLEHTTLMRGSFELQSMVALARLHQSNKNLILPEVHEIGLSLTNTHIPLMTLVLLSSSTDCDEYESELDSQNTMFVWHLSSRSCFQNNTFLWDFISTLTNISHQQHVVKFPENNLMCSFSDNEYTVTGQQCKEWKAKAVMMMMTMMCHFSAQCNLNWL